MKKAIVLLAVTLTSNAAFAEINATTEDGQKAILYDDGTWKYVNKNPKTTSGNEELKRKEPVVREKISLLKGKAAVYYDPKKWRNLKEPVPGRYEMTYKDGDLFVVVIAERTQMTMDGLRNIAISNGRKVAPDFRTVRQENRTVNGTPVLFMQTEGTSQSIEFVFLGYYFSDKQGSVQVLTYTSKNLLDEYRPEMEELLNGFQVL